MKQFSIFFGTILLLCIVTNSCSQKTNQAKPSILGIFVASTPCSEQTKPAPGIPLNADCELIKWNLTLYQDAVNKTPTTFKLHCIYGLPKQGTKGFIDGGKELEITGRCTIVKGIATNPNAMVYQLQDDKTDNTISFVKLSDDILHLLDEDNHLMIGSAAWSYTFNRKQK